MTADLDALVERLTAHAAVRSHMRGGRSRVLRGDLLAAADALRALRATPSDESVAREIAPMFPALFFEAGPEAAALKVVRAVRAATVRAQEVGNGDV